MKKSCFLAPVHEAKFNYAIELIKSYNNYFDDSDIYLVFSSKEEEDKFKELSQNLKYNSIIYEDEYVEGIITSKKYYGLNYLFSNTHFENVAVIDVDTLFTDFKDYDQMFTDYNNDIVIYANRTKYGDGIVQSCYKFFNEEDKQKIKETTKDNYFWFNEVPIYHKEKFLEFVNYIDYQNRYKELTWQNFDFVIYGYFLVLKSYAKFAIFNTECNWSFICASSLNKNNSKG